MTPMENVLCFLAREPGWRCLQALDTATNYRIAGLYTHRRKPTSEDPQRGERTHYAAFEAFARQRNIPFFIKDTFAENRRFEEIETLGAYDFVVSCNWKFLIPPTVLERARLGSVNLHRGKLPEYRGLEPVRRALQDGWDKIYLTAHVMEAAYDTGRILHEETLPATVRSGESLTETVERLKRELYPLYPLALLRAMDVLRQERLADR